MNWKFNYLTRSIKAFQIVPQSSNRFWNLLEKQELDEKTIQLVFKCFLSMVSRIFSYFTECNFQFVCWTNSWEELIAQKLEIKCLTNFFANKRLNDSLQKQYWISLHPTQFKWNSFAQKQTITYLSKNWYQTKIPYKRFRKVATNKIDKVSPGFNPLAFVRQ